MSLYFHIVTTWSMFDHTRISIAHLLWRAFDHQKSLIGQFDVHHLVFNTHHLPTSSKASVHLTWILGGDISPVDLEVVIKPL